MGANRPPRSGIGSSVDKKETNGLTSNNNTGSIPMRESFGVNIFDMKEVN